MSVAIALDGARADVREVPEVLTFIEHLPGLPEVSRCHLAAIDQSGFVFTLRSVDDPNVRLFALSPRAFFPGYDPEVSVEVRDALGADDAWSPLMLSVAHPGEGGATTANLLAPIVVDPATGAAVQVVLDGDEWPLRAPLGVADEAA